MSKSVSEQKTLKQIMREQRAKHYHLYGDTIPYNPINGVREWLRRKYHRKISFVENVENKFIDELLEDLDK